MKKIIIISLLLCSLLLTPVVARADTASDIATLKAELIILLQETIARLQAQIAEILASNQQLQAQVNQQEEVIQEQSQSINIIKEKVVMPKNKETSLPKVNISNWRKKLSGNLSGVVDISIDEEDIISDVGIKRVEYYFAGDRVNSKFDTKKYSNEENNLWATVYDNSDNSTTTISIIIRIKN